MIQFFARVVELREEKSVKCDGKITMDFPSREFLEVTKNPFKAVALKGSFAYFISSSVRRRISGASFRRFALTIAL